MIDMIDLVPDVDTIVPMGWAELKKFKCIFFMSSFRLNTNKQVKEV